MSELEQTSQVKKNMKMKKKSWRKITSHNDGQEENTHTMLA